MKKTILFLIVICWYAGDIYSQELLPESTGELVKHKYYTLSYNENHEQANWVYYILNEDLLFGNVERTEDFRVDPDVTTETATSADYKGSGYDRGHMCPAEAMSFNVEAMSESFFYSNMCPQSGSLNRGKWRSLENKVRKWAVDKKEIHVVSGPVFKNNIETFGINEITAPGYYYKIVYNPRENEAIAFVFANKKAKKKIEKYIVTVDWVEDITDIDFFSSLNDSIENVIEVTSDPSKWNLSGKLVTTSADIDKNRCIGITKKGARCSRKPKEDSDYCWQHEK